MHPPWPVAPRTLSILSVAWTVIANLVMLRRIRSRRLLLDYFVTKYMSRTLLGLSPYEPRKFWGRSVDTELRTTCPTEICIACFSSWLIVGVLRILCNGLCTAQRFHIEEHDHTCRVGCPNEPDSLSHYNECPRLYCKFTSFWGQAAVLPQNHLPHDLITQVFVRSLQYGIVVMGFIDAFVYAHHASRILGTLVIA